MIFSNKFKKLIKAINIKVSNSNKILISVIIMLSLLATARKNANANSIQIYGDPLYCMGGVLDTLNRNSDYNDPGIGIFLNYHIPENDVESPVLFGGYFPIGYSYDNNIFLGQEISFSFINLEKKEEYDHDYWTACLNYNVVFGTAVNKDTVFYAKVAPGYYSEGEIKGGFGILSGAGMAMRFSKDWFWDLSGNYHYVNAGPSDFFEIRCGINVVWANMIRRKYDY